ncbi:MAG TPA: dienelactone hydrolase family protein [bacterium]|nr:dienelactone hydrolase family protein [bacterium]
MKLRDEWITFDSGGSGVRAYQAWPDHGSEFLPAIIVIMEIWGVEDHIEDLVRRFATAGYLACAPELYSQSGTIPEALSQERIQAVKAFLDTVPPSVWQNPAERDAAVAGLPEKQGGPLRATMGLLFNPNRPMDRYVGHLRAAVRHVQAHPRARGMKVGATGYCMGGALSGRLACAEPHLAAAAIYYGAAPPAEQIGNIRCPVIGFYGGDDPRITEGVPAFAEVMRAAGKPFEHHVYLGAPHAFFNDTRRSFRLGASRDAWARTLAFFAHHLAAA